MSRTPRIPRRCVPNERAVSAAVARGIRSFEAIVIATEAEEPTPPCGICRQVLEEFSPHLVVMSALPATVARHGGRSTSCCRRHLPRTHWTGDEPESRFV